MGKKKIKKTAQPVLPFGKRQKIAAYLKTRGSGELADLILKGRFRPDNEKWTKFFNRIEKLKRMDSVTQKEVAHTQEVDNSEKKISQNLEFEKIREHIVAKTKNIVSKEAIYNVSIHFDQVRKFIHDKWKDIVSNKRTFGLGMERISNVEISVKFLNQFTFKSLSFYQKGFKPPSVGVDFVTEQNIGFPCFLDTGGKLIIHKELIEAFSDELQIVFNLAAVSYFYDLVIPKIEEPISYNKKSKFNRSNRSSDSSRILRIKPIPRKRKGSEPSNVKPSGNKKNHPSYVDPFRRRLPFGQKPTFAKIVEADQYGINLKGPGYPDVQYTFVKGHMRGTDDCNQILEYSYSQGYKAVQTFETMLNFLGFC